MPNSYVKMPDHRSNKRVKDEAFNVEESAGWVTCTLSKWDNRLSWSEPQTFDQQFKLTYMSILQLYILVSKLWAKVCHIRRKRENAVVRLTLPPLDCREWSTGFLLNNCPWLSASAKIRRSRSKSNWNRLLGTSPPWGNNWTCHSWYHIDWTRRKNGVSSRNKRRHILHHCYIRGNLVGYLNEDGKLINHVLVEQLGRLVW